MAMSLYTLVQGAMENGAAGYVLKDEPLSNLVLAIRTVLGGACWFLGKRYASVAYRLGWVRSP